MRTPMISAGFAILLVGLLAGCRPPLKVATLQLGRTLNSDNTVANITTRFKMGDSIYAAALTNDTGASTITARWSYNGRIVSETEKKVAYKGQAATAFEFKSADGFPPGDYKVEILVDGQPAGDRDFRVE